MIRTLFLMLLVPVSALALEARKLTDEGHPFTVVTVDPKKDDLRLFWKEPAGQPYVTFARLGAWATQSKLRLEFAMNAGMYMQDFAPLGLYIEKGRKLRPLNRRSGSGNFYLKPNGVFFVEGGSPRILETSRFAAESPHATLATQSGPLLVENGKVHPAFHADSPNRLIRNGVGVNARGEAVFAISDGPVNFYEFARLFRDRLDCRSALFLDGSVSAARVRALNRTQEDGVFGPILGVFTPLK